MGYLYDVLSSTLIVFSVVLQLAAIPPLDVVEGEPTPGRDDREPSGA